MLSAVPDQLLSCAKICITDWALIAAALMHGAVHPSMICYALIVSDASDCMLFGCIDITEATVADGADVGDG